MRIETEKELQAVIAVLKLRTLAMTAATEEWDIPLYEAAVSGDHPGISALVDKALGTVDSKLWYLEQEDYSGGSTKYEMWIRDQRIKLGQRRSVLKEMKELLRKLHLEAIRDVSHDFYTMSTTHLMEAVRESVERLDKREFSHIAL